MNIEQKVISIISEVTHIPSEKITLENKLIDLVSDSIQLFELLITFEKELGEKVSYTDVAQIESVKDIVAYAYKKKLYVI